MRKHALHKVRDLAPDTKHTVEILLGQVLQDDEAISLSAYSLPDFPGYAELPQLPVLEGYVPKLSKADIY